MKPLAIDLYCGLGGWTEGLLAEGWDVVGFDIEQHVYGEERYPAQLVVQDVLTLHGSQFRDADLIVGSSPCQEFSYRAMPWKRAKALGPPELGMKLFHAQFRIQREAQEAAGWGIPMVVENVRGAQPWVGRAMWNYGSYYLWGDVPALMPRPAKDSVKVPAFRFDGSGRSFQTASVDGMKNGGGSWFAVGPRGEQQSVRNPARGEAIGEGPGRRSDPGKGARFTSRDCGVEACNLSRVGFNVAAARALGDVDTTSYVRSADDKRQHIGMKRKMAAAAIAKIPFALSSHIARVYFPRHHQQAA